MKINGKKLTGYKSKKEFDKNNHSVKNCYDLERVGGIKNKSLNL